MEEKLLLLKKMLEPDFNWEKHYENNDFMSIEELFKDLYLRHDYKTQGDRPIPTLSCGSAELENTTKALYRILYLTKPDNIDFLDMYKASIMELHSPDYSFCANIAFFKYEIGVYFHCAKEFNNKISNLQCGWPGADNGDKCISDLGNLWFDILIKCLNYEHNIYPGNNFKV